VIDVLAKGNGFVLSPEHPNPLPAPQGNLMKTIVETTLVPDAQSPWLLYGFGAAVAVMLEMVALPALAFALGIYLPMYINLPVLAGGFAAWLLSRRGRNDREKGARKNQGILVASGLVAGAAIAGVFSAILKTIDQKDIKFGFIDMGGADGAINRAVNLSTEFTQQADGSWLSTERAWFEHYGPIVGLCALILLGVLCHFIAANAAKKQIEAEDAGE
jgi:hypothetical protein